MEQDPPLTSFKVSMGLEQGDPLCTTWCNSFFDTQSKNQEVRSLVAKRPSANLLIPIKLDHNATV